MSESRKIKTEDKIRIAKAYTKGTIGMNAAAEQLGAHPSVVDDWVRLYQTEGIEALLPQKENRRYDPALKEAAVLWYGHVCYVTQFARNRILPLKASILPNEPKPIDFIFIVTELIFLMHSHARMAKHHGMLTTG